VEGEVNRQSSEYSIWVQQSLNKVAGLQLAVDGVIGPKTRSAIRSFQQRQGLQADGIVGPKTELALVRAGAAAPPQGSTPSLSPYVPGPGGGQKPGGSPVTGGGQKPGGSPVTGGRITSPFGIRIHPVSHKRKLHKGTDIGGLPVGSTVSATAAGTVIFAASNGCAGNMVKVDHGNGYKTIYMHLNRITVSNGQKVVRGQKVGELGKTGCVTGPHVHYEVHYNDKATDPAPFL
jgi:murein DD-endopeptidase MepM/ murein hydrolase activator NlpD